LRFIDEATIEVIAGDGGKGCVSFLRQRFRPKGGPDGGDGGRGGNVILRADSGVTTLADHSYLRYFRAGRGGQGQSSNKTGPHGADKYILVPIGTVAAELGSGRFLADLAVNGQEVILARGGRGGKGNQHFVSSVHRSPRLAQPGEKGENNTILLTLKLLADAGLVGLPNAGKSTLISMLTAAHPKIGDYPFTTLTPNLGVLNFTSGLRFTVADIPGLVAGAHQGQGLGIKFLRHVERTRLIIYVIDISGPDPVADFKLLLEELHAYDSSLTRRAGLVVGNKIDLQPARAKAEIFCQEVGNMGWETVIISARQGQGLQDLTDRLEKQMNQALADSSG
jgi:GTP-binding protein